MSQTGNQTTYPNYKSPDPVHQEGNSWYFWDETWSDRHGPFDTQEQAEEALKEYAKNL